MNKLKVGQELIVTRKFGRGVVYGAKAKIIGISEHYFQLESHKNVDFAINTLESVRLKCYLTVEDAHNEIEKRRILSHLNFLLPNLPLEKLRDVKSLIFKDSL